MTHHIPARLGATVVRFLVASDHEAFIALERDAYVRRYVNGPSRKTDGEFLHGLRNYVPTTELLVIADEASNEFVGRCGLLPLGSTAEVELFVLLATSHHGKGIGSLVLQFLIDLAKIQGKRPIGIVHPENAASRALLERLGMGLTGSVSSANYQDGHLRYEPADG